MAGLMSYPAGTVLPYRFPVPYSGLTHGTMIVVQGWVPKKPERFEVNLLVDDENTAFHFNPRFGSGLFEKDKVVRGTKIGDGWGPEEDDGKFPFKKDAPFDIVILVQDECYRVAVNGEHFCNFNHRVMKDRVREISVEGDVAIITASIPRDTVEILKEPAFAVEVPHKEKIPNGVQPGTMILIAGKVPEDPERFHINIQNEDIGSPYADIALHFNPRFKPKKQVLRNSLQEGTWGDQETKAPGFPFKAEEAFTIMILVEEDGFKVAVNHQHYIDFPHRLADLGNIDTLYIEGDVMLAEVRTQY